ncbi:acetyl-CoA carboxylase, biotin carboxyl carrier protein [Amylibacter marinus]|uniref:Biotin carboxyl carrier protein of acetyl-CoA carboxylase n=1 Tax=Amylibacter marinus TaxID=1475483 RepID=A0ABQ5VSF1_9RHOB|nr:acetyl-CoA carboxylase biotin carboxyl carrier protein [Amylibacter marinus]GLQ34355.1 acetyl-CoA carboxylase, biotin carboxyl carrier protein [Amylibacter marinus]
MNEKDQNSDVKFIEALAAVLEQSDLAEVRVKRDYGDDKTLDVRVTRSFAPTGSVVAAPAPVAAAPAPIAAVASAPEAPAAASDDPAGHPGAVTSPMVGTAYLQPEPSAPAFVKVGDSIEEGQTILIVEAMKTMNQIPAPKSGKVARILVDDGTPVEFGTPLIILE